MVRVVDLRIYCIADALSIVYLSMGLELLVMSGLQVGRLARASSARWQPWSPALSSACEGDQVYSVWVSAST